MYLALQRRGVAETGERAGGRDAGAREVADPPLAKRERAAVQGAVDGHAAHRGAGGGQGVDLQRELRIERRRALRDAGEAARRQIGVHIQPVDMQRQRKGRARREGVGRRTGDRRRVETGGDVGELARAQTARCRRDEIEAAQTVRRNVRRLDAEPAQKRPQIVGSHLDPAVERRRVRPGRQTPRQHGFGPSGQRSRQAMQRRPPFRQFEIERRPPRDPSAPRHGVESGFDAPPEAERRKTQVFRAAAPRSAAVLEQRVKVQPPAGEGEGEARRRAGGQRKAPRNRRAPQAQGGVIRRECAVLVADARVRLQPDAVRRGERRASAGRRRGEEGRGVLRLSPENEAARQALARRDRRGALEGQCRVARFDARAHRGARARRRAVDPHGAFEGQAAPARRAFGEPRVARRFGRELEVDLQNLARAVVDPSPDRRQPPERVRRGERRKRVCGCRHVRRRASLQGQRRFDETRAFDRDVAHRQRQRRDMQLRRRGLRPAGDAQVGGAQTERPRRLQGKRPADFDIAADKRPDRGGDFGLARAPVERPRPGEKRRGGENDRNQRARDRRLAHVSRAAPARNRPPARLLDAAGERRYSMRPLSRRKNGGRPPNPARRSSRFPSITERTANPPPARATSSVRSEPHRRGLDAPGSVR